MLLFVGHSLQTMTGSAVRSGAARLAGSGGLLRGRHARPPAASPRQPGVAQASPTATAPFAGPRHRPAGTTDAGAARCSPCRPGYATQHPHLPLPARRAARRAGSCSTSSWRPRSRRSRGHRHATARPGARPQRFPVSGVAPDHLARHGVPAAQPAARARPRPATGQRRDHGLSHVRADDGAPAAHHPDGAAGAAAVPGGLSGVQWQVQAQLDPPQLTGSPSHAYTRAGQILHRVERTLPGQVQFVDNLSDSLNTAAGDALYAETLYIMLAVPGALIALGLAYLAALGRGRARPPRSRAAARARRGAPRPDGARRRRERARRRRRRGCWARAWRSARVQLARRAAGRDAPGAWWSPWPSASPLAVAGAAGGARRRGRSVLRAPGEREPARRPARQAAAVAAAVSRRAGAGLSGLDLLADGEHRLRRRGQPGLEPHAVAVGLHVLRPRAAVARGDAAARAPARARDLPGSSPRGRPPRARPRRGVSCWPARPGAARPSTEGCIVVGLLLAFGVNLGVFTATYDAQARVDAQLTLGADVTATAPPGAIAGKGLQATIGSVPGVAGDDARRSLLRLRGP